MTKRNVLVALVVVLLLVVAIGAQFWDGDDDPGVHQTDRDTVMDQAPAGRTGEGS